MVHSSWVALWLGVGEPVIEPEPEPEPVIDESTVRVVASRADSTASTTVVTAEALRSIPKKTAEDALRLVPGLTLVQHGSEGKGQQFFLRGFDAAHGADLAISLDGTPLNEWSNIHGQGYLDVAFIIPEIIRTVHVVPGPFTLKAGPFAMAGHVDYRLGVDPRDRGLRLSHTIGSTARHRGLVTYSPATGSGTSFIAMEAVRDEGFGERRGVTRGTLLARLRVLDHPRAGTLDVTLAGYHARFEVPGILRNDDVHARSLDFAGAYEQDNFGRSSRALIKTDYDWSRGRHRIQATAYGGYRTLLLRENYTGWLIDPIAGDRREQTHEVWSTHAQLGHRWWRRRFAVVSGVEVRADRLLGMQQHLPRPDGQRRTDRRVEADQVHLGGRLGVTFTPLAVLRVEAGVRVDGFGVSAAGLTGPRSAGQWSVAASPRASISWTPRAEVALMAAYGRGFRPPEAAAFVSYTPPQTGWSEDVESATAAPRMTLADASEIGLRIGPWRGFEAHASSFLIVMERESVYDHVSGLSLQLASTRRVGAEIGVLFAPRPWLVVQGNATYVNSRFVSSRRPIPFVPAWTVNGQVTFKHRSGISISMRATGFSRRPLPHGARGTPYARLDAVVAFERGPYRIALDAENLLNRKLREGEYHFASAWYPARPIDPLPVLHYAAGSPLVVRATLSAVF